MKYNLFFANPQEEELQEQPKKEEKQIDIIPSSELQPEIKDEHHEDEETNRQKSSKECLFQSSDNLIISL